MPTLTQVGYAVGMLFLVPLGDSLERRKVILLLCGCVGVALVVAGLAPGLNVLVAAQASAT
ncbi:major facilitator family transporter [Corallococcus coralloides]|uniref:Major facilitator family transporter n=1 Tax=Corallococcus coralloides TaxID=184914 RepID=A0A410RJK3_CORCK|nr:major facilitator family transporter [Corallococcus coralloides]